MNELAKESSPYLLQHAQNPVHWKAWNPNTLLQAQTENKLLIISIGYSTCHWCHVMEHESFESQEVAELMNSHFIAVKIDREEHPDADAYYMKAVQLMTKQGGWPLNVVCLPDGRPFWGGTYFKREVWLDSLFQLYKLFTNQPKTTEDFAKQLQEGITILSLAPLTNNNNTFQLEKVLTKWKRSFDHEYGGYTRVPKFMMPDNLLYLQKWGVIQNDTSLLKYIDLTLTKMAWGGIFDVVEGGFSRYSVDEKWHIPHFEKMLYDNAQLLSVYADAYKRTKDPLYKQVIEKTISFINDNWYNNEGGYFSALDADSLTADNILQEGAYYSWKEEELKTLILHDYDLFKQVFNINEYGYWENGEYVLIQSKKLEDIASKNNLSTSELETKKRDWESILLEYRKNKKVKPRLDDKTLTAWNAMLIQGLLDSYTATHQDEYLHLAIQNMNFIQKKLWTESCGLLHTYKLPTASITAYLDDYAFYIRALIALFEHTGRDHYLSDAKNALNLTLDYFLDQTSGFFYFSQDTSSIPVKNIETEDNVIPSSNAVMALNLLKMGVLYQNNYYTEIAKKMIETVKSNIDFPSAYSHWLLADLYLQNPTEISIVGSDAVEKCISLRSKLLTKAFLFPVTQQTSTPYLSGYAVTNKTLVYFCSNFTCQTPVEYQKFTTDIIL